MENWPRWSRLVVKRLIYSVFSLATLLFLVFIGFKLWLVWRYHLPSEHWVRQQFKDHRSDYVRFAATLQKDPSVRWVDGDGNVLDTGGLHSRLVPEYRELARAIRVSHVLVRDDGSMEFTLAGFGAAIASDSYMGVRFVPKEARVPHEFGWTQTVVPSLESKRLPQEKGGVATGLYVTIIEPEWFVYRFEYQEW